MTEIKIKYLVNSIESGGTPTSSVESNYDDNGIPWVAIKDMSSSECVFDTSKKISEKGLREKSLRVFPVGTVLYSIYATIGKVSELRIPATINQAILALSNCESKIQKEFLKYSLISIEGKVLYDASTNTQANLNSDKVKNTKIPVLDYETQIKVSSYLRNETAAIDGLIDKETQLLNNLLLYKTNYVKEQFAIINDYKTDRISSYADLTKGPFGSDMKKELFVPKGSNTKKVYIQENCLLEDESLGDYYITNSYYFQMSRFAIKPHDILITCDGTLGRLIELSDECEKGVISSSLLKVRIKNSLLSHDYFKLYWEYLILDDLLKETRNSALVHLPSASLIGKYKLKIPPIGFQLSFSQAINKKIHTINELIRLKTEKIEKLKEYKKSLISECVTGRREV